MVNSQTLLNKEALERISACNYSYVGIYENDKGNIVGTVKTKQLIESGSDRFLGKRIGSLSVVRPSLIVSADTNLMEMLMIFKSKRTKLAFLEE